MFSYDPKLINDGGLNQMRFELGDCLPDSFYLSDEEICAALANSSWRRAKFRLVDSLLFRFSYEVDTKIHEAEWKLSARVKFWQSLHARLKGELEAAEITEVLSDGLTNDARPAIFSIGMNDYVFAST